MKFRNLCLSMLLCASVTAGSAVPAAAGLPGRDNLTHAAGSVQSDSETGDNNERNPMNADDTAAEDEAEKPDTYESSERLEDDERNNADDCTIDSDERPEEDPEADMAVTESGLDTLSDESVSDESSAADESLLSDESLSDISAETKDEETAVGETIRRDIADGLYILVPKVSSARCVGVANNSRGAGANVELASNNGGFGQAFYVSRIEGTSRYTFVNYHSGKALHVQNNSKQSGANVIQNNLSGSTAQQWIIRDAGSGYLSIRACGKSTVLDIDGASSKAGTNIQVNTAKSNKNSQMWRLVRAGGKVEAEARLEDASLTKGYYRINTAGAESLPLDVTHNEKDDETNIRIFQNKNSGAQIFRIEPLGDGTYTITGYNSGKNLDCDNAKAGSNVYQWTASNSYHQRWYILKDRSTGRFVIRNRDASHVVLSAESAVSGANVTQSAFMGAGEQYWMLKKIAGSSIHVELKDGIYEFRSGLNGNMCLDVYAAGSLDNANMDIYKTNGTDAQRFAITCNGYGLYKVVNVNSMRALHLKGNSNVNGANVVQYKNFTTDAQKWVIAWDEKSKGYKIKSSGKALYLAVENGKASSGANVCVKSPDNSAGQKWVPKRISSYDGKYHIKVMCSGKNCNYKVYQIENGVFKEKLSATGFIGRNGSGKKSDGDGKTPIGTFTVGKAYGIEKDPGSRIPYKKITGDMYWCCRSNSPYYNTLIDKKKSGSGDVHLIDSKSANCYLLDIGFNSEHTPNLGSAIFLNCSRNQPTSGEVAIPQADMVRTLKMITPGTKISIE